MSAALVTGGSAGIGREVVKRLLAKGYEVFSLDVQPSDLKVHHIQVDLSDIDATKKILGKLKNITTAKSIISRLTMMTAATL